MLTKESLGKYYLQYLNKELEIEDISESLGIPANTVQEIFHHVDNELMKLIPLQEIYVKQNLS